MDPVAPATVSVTPLPAYAEATLPYGRLNVVNDNVVTTSVNWRTAKFALFVASSTRTVNVYVPDVPDAGVPLKLPLEESSRPVGSMPLTTVHEYDGTQHAKN